MSTILMLLLAVGLADTGEIKTAALLQTLPDDGAWTTYQIDVTGDEQNLSLTWTVRSVGTVMHDGKVCRYLELEQKCDGQKQIFSYPLTNMTLRAVIPESEFGEGKDPLAHAVRIWRQKEQDNAIGITSIHLQDPVLAAILCGPVSELKLESDSERIHWQRGELSCRVIAGQREMDFFGNKVVLSSHVLRHNDIPFSVSGIRQELKATVANTDYRVTVKATLLDHGTDARPTLGQLTP